MKKADALFQNIYHSLISNEGSVTIGKSTFSIEKSDGLFALKYQRGNDITIVAITDLENHIVKYLVDNPLEALKNIHSELIRARVVEGAV